MIYFVALILFALFYVLGLVLTPFNYFLRHYIRRKKITVLWWFLNDTTKFHKNDIDYGDFGRFSHNWWGFIRQNAFRNSHWNFKTIVFIPKKAEKENLKGNLEVLDKDWNFKIGWNYATYKIKGTKYFRLTFIKKIGNYYINGQMGAFEHRFKFKLKIVNKFKL